MGEKSNRSKWRNKLSFRSNKTKTESSSHSVTSIPTSQLVLAGPSAASSRPRTPLSNPQSKVAIEFQNEDRSKRIDRVSLPPILKHPSTNPIILRAQEELQEAFEELQAELIKYTDKYSGYAPLRDADLMKAAAEGSEGFGEVIEQVLSDQEAKGQNLSSKVGKFMGNVYPIAGVVLGILSFSGDAAGVLPLKITANALNTVVKKASAQQTRSEDVLSSLPDLKEHGELFASLEQLGYDRISDGLLKASTELFVAITNFLLMSLRFLNTNIVVDALTILIKDKLTEAKDALANALTHLKFVMTQEMLLDKKNRMWQKECKEAMEFLSDLPMQKVHEDVRNLRMKDSGQWILQNETFLKWIHGDLKTIWCPGKPGAGKTVLASMVIDHCLDRYCAKSTKKEAVGVAWLYCSYSSQSDQTIDHLMSSIIRQLITWSSDVVRKTFLNMLIDFHKHHKEGSPSLDDYLSILAHITATLERSVVIFDALDECAEIDSKGYKREWLIETLLGLDVQLLVTSRNLPAIQGLFDDKESFAKIVISPDPKDIESYISWRIFDKRFGSPKKLRDVIANYPSLLKDITLTVKEKYSQIFNLARLQMDQISRLTSYGAVNEALRSLPMTEDNFYGQSIDRIKANSGQADQALRILAWILRAKRPMTVKEMLYAAVVIPGEYSRNFEYFVSGEGDLIDICEGLVVVLPESGDVAFAHPTVNDFLESSRGSVFLEDPEIIIASACITYLASDHLFNNEKRLTLDSSPQRFKYLNPFLFHSAFYWLEYTSGGREEALVDFIIELFKRRPRAVILKQTWRPEWKPWSNWYSGSTRRYALKNLRIHTDGVWIASSLGLAYTVRRLIGMGAFWVDFEGRTLPESEYYDMYISQQPLLISADLGHLQVVLALLESGVKVNGTNKLGQTYLHTAVRGRPSRQLLETFLKWGANIEARTLGGRTPLHEASLYGDQCDMVLFLLESGANINVRDNAGDTPLLVAIQGSQTRTMISLLLKYGAAINAKNHLGSTALHKAAKIGRLHYIELLIKNGADLDARNTEGETALQIAAKSGHLEAINYLIQTGADLEALSYDEWTLPHLASQVDDVNSVKSFLGEGEDVINAED